MGDGNETVGDTTEITKNVTEKQSSVDACLLFTGDDIQCDIVVATKRAASSLSILGSMFTLFLIVFFKKYKDPSQRMIANLSIASLLLSASCLIEDIVYENTTLCRIQGALLTQFVWNCCLWIMCIVFNLYFKLIFGIDLYKRELAITMFCWLFPVVTMSLPFIDDVYGPAGVWCWMKNDWRWRFGDWYFFRIGSLIIFVVVMIHMTVVMYRMKTSRLSSNPVHNTISDDIKTLRLYPIVYFLVNIFPVVNRIQNAVSADEQKGYVFGLLLFQSIADPSFGAIAALVYVLDSRTRKKLKPKQFREAAQRWRHRPTQIKEFSLSSTCTST